MKGSILPVLALLSQLFVASSAFRQNETACGACTCWARSTCEDGDESNALYSEANPTCKVGIIDCRDAGLSDPPVINNGTVTVTELDQMYGTYYKATYDIGKIWMSGNGFEEIPADYFKNVSSTVSEIYLNNNPELETLHPNTFKDMPSLKYLLLHYSGINALPATLFGGTGTSTTNLEKFWAHNNNIATVDATTFQGVGASLEELYMGDNSISSLDAATFSGLTGLKELWMMGNDEIAPNCANMCDVPAAVDVKIAEFTLSCGATCPVSTPPHVTDTTGCGFSTCTTWDLAPAWRAGPGLIIGAIVAGAILALA